MNKDTEFVMFMLLRDNATWVQIHDLFQPLVDVSDIISQTNLINKYLEINLYLGENINWELISRTFSILWDALHLKQGELTA